MYLPRFFTNNIDPPATVCTRALLSILDTLFTNVTPESVYFKDRATLETPEPPIDGVVRVVAGVNNPAAPTPLILNRLAEDLLDRRKFAPELALLRKYEAIANKLVDAGLIKGRAHLAKMRELAP